MAVKQRLVRQTVESYRQDRNNRTHAAVQVYFFVNPTVHFLLRSAKQNVSAVHIVIVGIDSWHGDKLWLSYINISSFSCHTLDLFTLYAISV